MHSVALGIYASFHGFCPLQRSITRSEGVVDTLALTYSLYTSIESFHKLAREYQKRRHDGMIYRNLASYLRELSRQPFLSL